MNIDEILNSIVNKSRCNTEESMQSHIYEMKEETNEDKIAKIIMKIKEEFQENIERQDFFNLNVPLLIIDIALNEQTNNELFITCSELLRCVLEESPKHAQPLIEEIIKYFHKQKYTEKIKFYILIALLCKSEGSGTTLLNSKFGPLLIKFYRSFVEKENFNYQVTDAFSLELYDEIIDEDSDEKSTQSKMSSLSLDEDRVTRENVKKVTKTPESARSMLSEFAETLYDDNVEIPQTTEEVDNEEEEEYEEEDNEGDIEDSRMEDSQFQDVQNRFDIEEEEVINSQEEYYNAEGRTEAYEYEEENIENENSSKRTLFPLPQKIEEENKSKLINDESLEMDNYAYKEPLHQEISVNEIDKHSNNSMRQVNNSKLQDIPKTTNKKQKQEFELAEDGPMTLFACKEEKKPDFIPLLKMDFTERYSEFRESLIVAKEESDKEAKENINFELNDKEIVDESFANKLDEIEDARKGLTFMHEIGKLIGEFIAMSDYPTIIRESKKQKELDKETIEKHSTKEIDMSVYTDSHKRDFDDWNFNFDEILEYNEEIQQQSPENITRIGILFILYTLCNSTNQLIVPYFPEIIPVIILDLSMLRSKKSGFLPLSVKISTEFLSLIYNVMIPFNCDDWNNVLNKTYDHIDTPLEFYDEISKRYITMEKENMKVVERRTIILNSSFNLLERLQGLRRSELSSINIISEKLTRLCMCYEHLSALEDISVCLGVFTDILSSSKYNTIIKTAFIENSLPALLKLLGLIITRKIKSREYYIFISHRLLQVFNLLMISDKKIKDFEENNESEIFINIFVKEEMQINEWLKRYAYLILMNSRVKIELSGLYINEEECNDSFNEIRKTFFEYVNEFSKLVVQYYYNHNFNLSEEGEVIDLKSANCARGLMSNLYEDDKPLGRDDNFDLKYNIDELPLHMMLENELTNDCLFEFQNKTVFEREHNTISEKISKKQLELGDLDIEYIIDYDIGVLMEFEFLNEDNILHNEENRDIYLSCVKSLENFINIPNMLKRIEKQQLNKFIMYHYLSFLKFYNSSLETFSTFETSNFELATAHLGVLKAFTEIEDESIRQHVYIIKIVDFLIEELTFELNLPLDISEEEANELLKEHTLCIENLNTNLNESFRELTNNTSELTTDLDFEMDNGSTNAHEHKEFKSIELSLILEEKKEEGGNVLKQRLPTLTETMLELRTKENSDISSTSDSIDDDEYELPSQNLNVDKTTNQSFENKSLENRSKSLKKGMTIMIDLAEINQNTNEGDENLSPTVFNMNNLAWVNETLFSPRVNVSINKDNNKSFLSAISYSDKKSNQNLSITDDDSDLSDIPPPETVIPKQNPEFSLFLNVPEKVNEEISIQNAVPLLPILDNSSIENKSFANENGKIDMNFKMHLFQGAEMNESEKQPINTSKETKLPSIPIYYDDDLHELLILFLLQLIIKPSTETLDELYVTQFPTNAGITNILYILHYHLNNPINKEVTKRILEKELDPAQDRLVRLLCFEKFDPTFYKLDKFELLAKGAFGEVYEGNVELTVSKELEPCATPVAIKVQKLSETINDRCVLHDLYNEITTMEKLESFENFCEIYDYGVTPQGYIMVMERYHSSFRNFRFELFKIDKSENINNDKRKLSPYGHELSMMKFIRVFLYTYLMFLEELELLHNEKVIHFDLKADNIFLNPATIEWLCLKNEPVLDGKGEFQDELLELFKAIKHESELPYTITIADFGEAHIFSSENDKHTLLSKGTEFNKSPEMLTSANQQFKKEFNTRKEGSGPDSDIWSAACTLYEIITGDYLFYDSDWIRFFLRVTTVSPKIEYGKDSLTFCDNPFFAECIRGLKLIPEKRAMLGNCQSLIDLLEFELVEDPSMRPSIEMCIDMTKHVLKTFFPHNYKFNDNLTSRRVECVAGLPFPSDAWNFDIIGSLEELTGNITEILAPECSIINQNIKLKGERLTCKKPFYIMQPTDVLQNGFLMLGSVEDLQDNEFIVKNNIQTIIDCTMAKSSPESVYVNRVVRPSSKFEEIFRNENYILDKDEFKDLIISLEEVFDAIRCTFALNGCVLLIDETSNDFAANLIIACLMEFESMYLYESVIYLKRLRPSISINSNFMELLLIWHDKRTKIGLKLLTIFPYVKLNSKISLEDPEIYNFATIRISEANYKCVCGRTFFVVKPKTQFTYLACNCIISDEYAHTFNKEEGKIVDCPTTSCRTIENYYMSLYALKLYKLVWLYINDDSVFSNWMRATQSTTLVEEFPNAENKELEFKCVDETRAPLYRIPIKDDWRLHYCLLCGAPTHCVRIKHNVKELAILATFSNK